MKKLLLVFFFSIFFLKSQSQTSVYHPFPDSNAVWNQESIIYFGCSFFVNLDELFSYVLSGDTVIKGVLHHKIYIPYVQSTCIGTYIPGYKGAIRQDIPNRKVYFVPPQDSMDHLLYDFNIHVGDSIIGFLVPYCDSAQYAMRVQSEDSILINNNYRKRWTLFNFNFGQGPDIIEGIGSSTGLLESICPIIDGASLSLNCFSQNGKTIYPDSTTSCKIIDGINTLLEKNSSLSVSPNPAHDVITINTGGLLRSFLPRNDVIASEAKQSPSLSIYNMMGEQIKPLHPALSGTNNLKQETTMDISNLAAGVYLVQVTDGEKTVRSKFIKQ